MMGECTTRHVELPPRHNRTCPRTTMSFEFCILRSVLDIDFSQFVSQANSWGFETRSYSDSKQEGEWRPPPTHCDLDLVRQPTSQGSCGCRSATPVSSRTEAQPQWTDGA